MNGLSRSAFLETMDQAITPIIIVDDWAGASALYLNKVFCAEIGYDIHAIPDKASWWLTAYPDPDYRAEIMLAWNTKQALAKKRGDPHFSLTARIHCADSSMKWYEVHCVEVYCLTMGRVKVVTFLNINRIKERNEKLINVIQQKALLFSILTHDIRSPLGNIKSILDGYEMNYLNKNEICEVAVTLIDQIGYLLNMIDSTRLRVGSERGTFKFRSEEIKLNVFLDSCRHVFSKVLSNAQINLIFEIPEPAIIYYDQFILEIIFRNIIDNAIKYTPKNGVIKISLIHHEKYSSLVITDSGKGMTSKQIDAIAHNTNQRAASREIVDGFGLGLISAKEILEKHRGKLAISSTPAKGTSCEIMIYN